MTASMTSDELEEVWRLPVIVSGSVAGVIVTVIVVSLCACRRVKKANSSKLNDSNLPANNQSPNHVVIQVLEAHSLDGILSSDTKPKRFQYESTSHTADAVSTS